MPPLVASTVATMCGDDRQRIPVPIDGEENSGTPFSLGVNDRISPLCPLVRSLGSAFLGWPATGCMTMVVGLEDSVP